VDLLEHDQWQPGGDDIAELVHRGDDDGTLFIVRTSDFIGPTIWAILAVTLLLWAKNLRKEETSSRSTHATEKETCPFPAATDVPNSQGTRSNNLHNLSEVSARQYHRILRRTAPKMIGGQRRPFRTVSDDPKLCKHPCQAHVQRQQIQA
jgi:hypothetical protein